ncbi:hydantoinase/oxoprolinase family protein [Mesorhizobium sp.]|uniref:hydantoinase/oxoprolinase family protein n=1 Tax=Mesorhizobium sp. TaxID=1871066 RepID=UPI000FE715F6|nr:hydantoinase/oxoprolinase family protein [Mesorhizobium sp.]RWD79156.1 MAG: hydantoinase/oxoprolinase family protein [Mesorhizobium sp.]
MGHLKAGRLAADIGGTFTDVALECGPRRITAKVLTTPLEPERGVVRGILEVLKNAALSPAEIEVFVHGTTLATNALIERKGATTALVTTEGFRDVIEIGRESRFDQYDINLVKPQPLVPRSLRVTVPERLAVDGSVVVPLDLRRLEDHVRAFRAANVTSIAVGLLHSYVNSSHEEQVGERLQQLMPDAYVSLSSKVCPEVREYERLMTTCANAYVQPQIASYLQRLRAELDRMGLSAPMVLMTSGGGLTTLENACELPIRLVESGPAGGAILASHVGSESGESSLLSFDMGGTTAKICIIDNSEPLKSRSFEVARSKRFMKGSGMPIRIPVIEMVEIGAGGGSIARVDTLGRIQVGPESATSEPGPACYGRGGNHATVTDADLVLGKIDRQHFAGGSINLRPDASRDAIASHLAAASSDIEMGAFGICEVVEENMANASRVHAIERGKDVRARTMVAFGGAAPLHAARLAEKLGIRRVIVPRSAGVGSAVGFLRAPLSYEVVRSLFVKIPRLDVATANRQFDDMVDEAAAVVRAAKPDAPLEVRRSVFLRYSGQGHEIDVALPDRALVDSDRDAITKAFTQAYQALYKRTISQADIEALSWAVTVTAVEDRSAQAIPFIGADVEAEPLRQSRLFDGRLGKFIDSPVYWRDAIGVNQAIVGPAVIAEDETSTVVTSSFVASIDPAGSIILDAKH